MKRFAVIPTLALIVMAGAAALRASEEDAIGPESVDDVTLALSKLALENLDKCERIRDFVSQYLTAANEGRSS